MGNVWLWSSIGLTAGGVCGGETENGQPAFYDSEIPTYCCRLRYGMVDFI